MSDQPNTPHVVHSRGQDYPRPQQLDLFGGKETVYLKETIDVEVRLEWWFSCPVCQQLVSGTMELEAVSAGNTCTGCGASYTVRYRPSMNPPGWEAIKNGE